MHRQKRTLIWINVVGGLAVISSYVMAFSTRGISPGAFWGGVPENWRGWYVASMILAILGYFVFTGFIIFTLDPEKVRIADFFNYGILKAIYLDILIPSAMWVPLTMMMLRKPSQLLWIVIRLVLANVSFASLALLFLLAAIEPGKARWLHALAILGAIFFFFQTGLLDAILWPYWFMQP